MPTNEQPDWERLLAAAARLQHLLPDATLVGGTASAVFAGHRVSYDADHVLADLRSNFDEVLAQLESVAGWQTARVKRPVMILGSLDGIETGVRQLIRQKPLETCEVEVVGQILRLPTEPEMLRIKAVLILKRNATRDYLDFVAIANHMGIKRAIEALKDFDNLYPQPNEQSALQQLHVQLASPMPYDLEQTDLAEYRQLKPEWQQWDKVRELCADIATRIFRGL